MAHANLEVERDTSLDKGTERVLDLIEAVLIKLKNVLPISAVACPTYEDQIVNAWRRAESGYDVLLRTGATHSDDTNWSWGKPENGSSKFASEFDRLLYQDALRRLSPIILTPGFSIL